MTTGRWQLACSRLTSQGESTVAHLDGGTKLCAPGSSWGGPPPEEIVTRGRRDRTVEQPALGIL